MMIRNTSSPINFANDDSSSSNRSDAAVRRTGSRGFEQMTPLAPGYFPGDDDVLVGRGKKCLVHTGNLYFKQIVATKLRSYLEAECRVDKTAILMEVIDQVRANSPNGGFVKQNPKTGQWFEIGDFLAKEKTAQAFRDALHEYYTSSNPSKKKRRIHSTVSSDSIKKGTGNCSVSGESSHLNDVICEQSLLGAMHSQYTRRRSKSAPNSPTIGDITTAVRSATPPPSFARRVTTCEPQQPHSAFPMDDSTYAPNRRKSSAIISGDTLAMLSLALTDTHFSDHESVSEDPFEPIPLFMCDVSDEFEAVPRDQYSKQGSESSPTQRSFM
jgi:hypothetical protein